MSIFIIAEAGVNHNGSLCMAKELVDLAKEAGADCVKFQTFISEKIVSFIAPKAAYQEKQTGSSQSHLEMLKSMELSYRDFHELKSYCIKREILFMSSPFDLESIEFLYSLGMSVWKIPSGEITNLPYLESIAKKKQKVIMSTGMCTLEDIKEAVRTLNAYGTDDITLLHCTSEYPASYDSVNLNALRTMKDVFGLPVGYSDHTLGIEISIAAAALGASVIERHITLDKNQKGPDHKASLSFEEMHAMVTAIRHVETAMGTGRKMPMKEEYKNINIVRKSIIASKRINKGDIFTVENITVKRPGNGISPMKWYRVLGEKAKRNFEKDELIEL